MYSVYAWNRKYVGNKLFELKIRKINEIGENVV